MARPTMNEENKKRVLNMVEGNFRLYGHPITIRKLHRYLHLSTSIIKRYLNRLVEEEKLERWENGKSHPSYYPKGLREKYIEVAREHLS